MPRQCYPLVLSLLIAAFSSGCNVAPSTGLKPTTTAASLTVGTNQVSFGSVAVGATKKNSLIISNPATSPASATIASIKLSGIGFGFGFASLPTLPMVLDVGKSVTLALTFQPKAPGSVAGQVTITSDAADPSIGVELNGMAPNPSAGTISLSPASLEFGSVLVGAVKSQTASLAASGSSVTVQTLDHNGEGFSVSGITFPFTIAPGKSVSFAVSFQPSLPGNSDGQLTFLTSSNSPSATLEGDGVVPTQHQVSLSWNPGSSEVLGYNLYRGTHSGGPYYRLNSSPRLSTDFADASVQSGATYFYVVTSLDLAHLESGYSNQTKAVIPSP